MIKKITVISIGILAIVLLIMVIYFRFYQNLPEFSISLLPDFNTPQKGQSVVIFSPHTDDETLGAGGLISKSIQNGAVVTVVFITNGDGHRFSSVEEFHKFYPSAENYIQSGYDRQNESKNALNTLGISENNIIFLGYPDGGLKSLLSKNWQNSYLSPYTKQSVSPYTNSFTPNVSYTGVNLQNDILKVLNQTKPDYVFVTHTNDIHPDHSAAGTLVTSALKIYNSQNNNQAQEYYYLIHYRHYPYPKNYHPDHYLMPPLRLLTSGWFKFNLDQQSENIKETAVKEYPSQLKVPLLNSLMQGFVKKNELFYKVN